MLVSRVVLLLLVAVTLTRGEEHAAGCPHLAALARSKRQQEQSTASPRPSTRNETKPLDEEWILDADPLNKTGLAEWLLHGCWGDDENGELPCTIANYRHVEYSGYDGWYNNHAHPELGAVDTPLLRRVPAAYEDGVYQPRDSENRPNPLTLSENFFKGDIGTQSRTGKTALLVFFGQQMVEEILDAQRPACPPEYFNIKVPQDHEYHTDRPKHSELPLLRTRFDMRTGFSPGNPRQQLNEITPWLDGGLTYGTSKAWADQLRRYKNGSLDENGMLAGANDTWLFPEYNTHRLPLANPPPPAEHDIFIKQHETAKVNRFFRLGNPRGNENPFLLTFGVVWFRWHNVLARELRKRHADWSSERVYNEARKWVIASHQQVVLYEWLPTWLGSKLPDYDGYNAALDPQIDQFFQTTAMRFGHTLVVPGVYLRDYARFGCGLVPDFNVVRTCNFYWRPQVPMLHTYNVTSSGHGGEQVHQVDIDRLIMGMASQLTEEEDHTIVEDLRGRVFGPLEFSRRDLMAINIQRARDHGVPDFNTARRAYGLEPVTEANLDTHYMHVNQTIRDRLRNIYKNYSDHLGDGSNWWDHIDIWVGGLLETKDSPGELFQAIIRDQFMRIRGADRFWFENRQNDLFTEEELIRLKQLRFRDILMSVTHMMNEDLQHNPFRAPEEDELDVMCVNQTDLFYDRPFSYVDPETNENRTGVGRVLKRLTTHGLNNSFKVDECVPANTYDYFSTSEGPYLATFLCLFAFIGGLFGFMVYWGLRAKKRKEKNTLGNKETLSKSFKLMPHSAQEWQGKRAGSRAVVVLLNAASRQVEVRSNRGAMLRALDLSHCNLMQIVIGTDGLHLMLHITNDYDLVLIFESTALRQTFCEMLEDMLSFCDVERKLEHLTPKLILKQAVTRACRQKQLEKFFRMVFSQAFQIRSQEDTTDLDSKTTRDIINTELTISEFAEALSMRSDAEFVQKIFLLADKDKNGFISFREFADMLVIFSKGSADAKAKLMFDMYDIDGSGELTRQDFTNMLKSLLETVNADVEQEDLESVVSSMMQAAGLANKTAMKFEDFQRLLIDYKDRIGVANLTFQGVPESMQMQGNNNRLSHAGQARKSFIDLYQGEETDERRTSNLDHEHNIVTPQKQPDASKRTPMWWLQVVNTVDNFRLQIFWVTLYTLVLLAIFAERAYYYSVEREHSGLRRIAGYGVTVTRGAASAMMFTYSTMLITMCRNTITYLRDTRLNRIIPFDNAVDMHKYIAYWALFFTVVHTIGHAFNFYHISTQTSDDLACLFRNFFHPTHAVPKFERWCWGTITGVTGVLLVILTALMYTFATRFAREHLHNWFWVTHSLYPLFFLLNILHGAGRLIQEPFIHYFFLGPCILFVLDKLISLSRKKVEIPVLKAEMLPSDVTMLEFMRPSDFDYKSGQWIRIACPALNSVEYHPFTLSSAPNEKNLTVHIRAVGPWTGNIRRLYDEAMLAAQPLPKIHLDGPYGESHQDWFQSEVTVLVGGGIGVTPYSSILKDIVYRANNTRTPITCKKVYFLWVTKTQKHFEWMVDILRELEKADTKLVVSVHIFVTQFFEEFDLRTILLYICERHFQRICGRSLFTGLQAVTHFGRPNCDQIFKSIQTIHPRVRKIGVFSCGPGPLTQQVDRACASINLRTRSGPLFDHHFENF